MKFLLSIKISLRRRPERMGPAPNSRNNPLKNNYSSYLKKNLYEKIDEMFEAGINLINFELWGISDGFLLWGDKYGSVFYLKNGGSCFIFIQKIKSINPSNKPRSECRFELPKILSFARLIN
ncbi:hypothetical protein BpHYR1_026076 [Brachionus plicatilis]|uniref:Uncharacterized protein n=1 Tax=Brachionus plicatilis TaxID=10195 RepID=A0A3M7S622_BRAPC|nr:hypothetical protein BpHYR1_026076 [Brachionus plicatilis]